VVREFGLLMQVHAFTTMHKHLQILHGMIQDRYGCIIFICILHLKDQEKYR